jgi:hypothetical protein
MFRSDHYMDVDEEPRYKRYHPQPAPYHQPSSYPQPAPSYPQPAPSYPQPAPYHHPPTPYQQPASFQHPQPVSFHHEEPASFHKHQPSVPGSSFDSEHFEHFAFEPLKFDAPYSPGQPHSYEIPVLTVPDQYEPAARAPPRPAPYQPEPYLPPYKEADAPADLPPPSDFGRGHQFPFLAAQSPAGVAHGGGVGSRYSHPPPPLQPSAYAGPSLGVNSPAAVAVVENSNQFVNVEDVDTWESGHVRGSPTHSRQEYSRREGRTFKQQV